MCLQTRGTERQHEVRLPLSWLFDDVANEVDNLANEVENLANEVDNLARNFWLDSQPRPG